MRVIFPDPILATLDVLRDELALIESTTSVSFGSVSIEEATAKGVRLPYLRVELDNSETRYPVSSAALLRLTIWAEDWRTLEIAQVVRAVLRDYGGPKVRSYGDPAGGPFASKDPDTDQALSTMTITARLKPERL